MCALPFYNIIAFFGGFVKCGVKRDYVVLVRNVVKWN